mmetsp:Transcript_26609/g.56619  ORF Transcript_26609/g.56619 Transcript_26609/m.56619 type:complete len:354 (+) Transcript_26609:64-1125(+)
MAPTRSLLLIGIAASMAIPGTDAFSPSLGRAERVSTSLNMEPKGCASKPFEKKKIAIFGAGGYLGATAFGFLQRAASLYGTGIAAGSSPRAICATSGGPEGLNKVLVPSFKLAYAGEDLVRLVDTSDVDHIAERLKTFDACILGTTYQLEQRTVTLNTYEKTVNDKTYEMYLDERYGAWQNNVPDDDAEIHASIFSNSVRACREAGISHLVVVETPRTAQPMDFVTILEEEGIAYTYVRAMSALKKDVNFTFEKGISNKLGVVNLPAGSSVTPFDAQNSGSETSMYREDFAALIVQSLMTLDWGESRILEVSSTPGSTLSSGYKEKRPANRPMLFDKEWCPNSEVLAEVLSTL